MPSWDMPCGLATSTAPCFTKGEPVKDWVKLSVTRCRANNFLDTSQPCKAIFWLDDARPHDVNIIRKVRKYLPLFKPEGLDSIRHAWGFGEAGCQGGGVEEV